ncbi:hypothetical protein [Vibrio phage PJN101]|nr:hypothetical protein [Vibrio phage PJN101]
MKYSVYYIAENPDKNEPACMLVAVDRGQGDTSVHFNPIDTFKAHLDDIESMTEFLEENEVVWTMKDYSDNYPDDNPTYIGSVESIEQVVHLAKSTMLIME